MIFSLFAKGGPIMFFLLLCSILGGYIVVERLLYFNFHFKHIDQTVSSIKNKLLTNGINDTILSLRTQRNIITRSIYQSIKLVGKSHHEISDGIKDSVHSQIPKIERFMSTLSSIITVAPILGLTGTVLGLMDIFNVISGGGIGDASLLSAGIAEALITTVTGLLIVVPFIFIYQHLTQKIEEYIILIERICYDIVVFCSNQTSIKP
jgi:biopolymer transport protein ExbB